MMLAPKTSASRVVLEALARIYIVLLTASSFVPLGIGMNRTGHIVAWVSGLKSLRVSAQKFANLVEVNAQPNLSSSLIRSRSPM